LRIASTTSNARTFIGKEGVVTMSSHKRRPPPFPSSPNHSHRSPTTSIDQTTLSLSPLFTD
jgi:hypothetical protein